MVALSQTSRLVTVRVTILVLSEFAEKVENIYKQTTKLCFEQEESHLDEKGDVIFGKNKQGKNVAG